MTLDGSLDELPLLDVLQLLTVAGRSGSFRLAAEGGSGEIVLSHGEIVDARTSDLRGEPALFDLCRWRSGSFAFEPSEVAAEDRTIRRDATAVMSDAAHQLDAWETIEEIVPSTGCVPVLNEATPTANVVLTPSDWTVVRNIDGVRTVAEIAGAARKSLFDTCNSLTGLIRTGLVCPLVGENVAERTGVSRSESREEAATV